jgi:hypothetical protein
MVKQVGMLLGFALMAGGISACGGPDPVSSLSEPLKQRFACPYIECTCSCNDAELGPNNYLYPRDDLQQLLVDQYYYLCTVSSTGTCAGFNGAPCSGYPKNSLSKVPGKLVDCSGI